MQTPFCYGAVPENALSVLENATRLADAEHIKVKMYRAFDSIF